ncbi:hypothetical protein XO10_07995 [Marinitoga sp. 1135]|uniref:Maltose-binding periplasmic protein n=1 Tax=Marinitoga piezophila (strain DSM 14283 / JCM 11233 / KA3) TaxID=443254 RepID=H2J4Z5_MARPK|nr:MULTISPECIES: extracellular solute-binding protein [Marinitoga]AEX86012.1 hypothetical protein Marpi_1623 [Marinitoga piezophila KA3]APT76437.1 hypothetical protein LN42_08655 [Marinitoga sp. 1137]NUU96200.1 hypothetical protein [Marinitoga sp. 1135]NUU98123.1 hypothetical protein [Marinitoga sp. 1138]
MKKILGIALILVLIGVYILYPRKNINIVTQMSEEEIIGLEKILKHYEMFHFIKFNIIRVPFSGHFSRIQEMIKQNINIDIARVDIKMPEWFKKYVKSEPVLQAVDTLVMIYDANDKIKPPETINDFFDFIENNTVDINGKTIKDKGFDKDKIMQYAVYIPYVSGWWMSVLYGSNDRNFLTENADKENFISISRRIKYYYKNGLIPRVCSDFYEEMMRMFISGDVKIIFNGPWSFSTLREKGKDFKVYYTPRGFSGRFSPMGGQQWVLLKDNKYTEKAFEYLGSNYVAEKFYEYNSTLMPNKGLIERLEKSGNIVASQLKDAVKIDKNTDYILYEFFSNEFVEYLNDKISEEKLFESWLNKIKYKK